MLGDQVFDLRLRLVAALRPARGVGGPEQHHEHSGADHGNLLFLLLWERGKWMVRNGARKGGKVR